MEKIDHIVQFLDKPEHSIVIEYSGIKKQVPHLKKDKFYYTKEAILRESQSIEEFLQQLPKSGFKSGTIINFYGPNGSGKRKVNAITLNFQNEMQHQQQNVTTPYNANVHGMYGNNPNGLVHPAVSKLDSLTEKHNDLKIRFEELKDDYKNVKSELRVEKETVALKELELATINKLHDLEIQRINSDKKSALDSPGFTVMVDKLSKMISPLLLKGNSTVNPNEQKKAMAAPALSEDKIDFIEMISKPFVRDEDVNTIFMIYHLASKNEAFAKKLEELITQYNNDDDIN